MKRLRRQIDGSYSLTTVTPAPSGLSHAGDVETKLLTLTHDELAQIVQDFADGTAALPDPVSDTTVAKDLSNAKE